jgi:hypothetical protein
MPLRSYLRARPALWALPVTAVLVVLFVRSWPPADTEYSVSHWAHGLSTVYLLGPVAAGFAAWELGRLRAARVLEAPNVRSRFRVIATPLLPVVGAAWLAMLAAVLAVGVTGLPPLTLLAPPLGAVLALTAVGALLGAATRLVVAVPVAFLGSYLWMVLPMGGEPLWLRHLTGHWPSCCPVNTEIAPEATVGALLVNLAVVACCGLLLLLRRSAVVAGTAALVLAVGATGGVLAVRHLGPDPVRPRQDALLCRTVDGVRTCVWPEHRARLTEVSDVAAAAASAWRGYGLTPPTVFTEGLAMDPGQVDFGFLGDATTAELVWSVSSGMLPPYPACADTSPWLAYDLEPYLHAWLVGAIGLPVPLPAGTEPAVRETVSALRARPVSEQGRWAHDAVEALKGCDSAGPAIRR